MLYIRQNNYEEIILHAMERLPEESCGLIAGIIEGEDKRVEKIYKMQNVNHSEEQFAMEPKEQIRAAKDARERGLTIIGNYHSHPKAPAFPSKKDIELAYDLLTDYWIVSLMDLEQPVLRAFRFDEKKEIKEIPVCVYQQS